MTRARRGIASDVKAKIIGILAYHGPLIKRQIERGKKARPPKSGWEREPAGASHRQVLQYLNELNNEGYLRETVKPRGGHTVSCPQHLTRKGFLFGLKTGSIRYADGREVRQRWKLDFPEFSTEKHPSVAFIIEEISSKVKHTIEVLEQLEPEALYMRVMHWLPGAYWSVKTEPERNNLAFGAMLMCTAGLALDLIEKSFPFAWVQERGELRKERARQLPKRKKQREIIFRELGELMDELDPLLKLAREFSEQS